MQCWNSALGKYIHKYNKINIPYGENAAGSLYKFGTLGDLKLRQKNSCKAIGDQSDKASQGFT